MDCLFLVRLQQDFFCYGGFFFLKVHKTEITSLFLIKPEVMWLMIRVKVILDNPQTSPANRRFEWFASVDHLSNCGKPALLITSKNQDSSSCLFLSDTILILYLLRTIFHVLSTSSLHIICLLTFGLPLHWSDSKVKKLTLFDLFFFSFVSFSLSLLTSLTHEKNNHKLNTNTH